MVCNTRLKTLRERYGLTQQDIADRLGLSVPTVSRIERGQSTPKPVVQRAIDNIIRGLERRMKGVEL